MGGKIRIGRKLAAVINAYNAPHYYEPFCGLFSVGCHVDCNHRKASDTNQDLIFLMQELRKGWKPPAQISEEEYKNLQYANSSALRGFVGFGCSFYGKFFGGYARDKTQTNYAKMACTSLLKLAPLIRDVDFQCSDYRHSDFKFGLIYCDPPYAQSTNYSCGTFNNAEFWDWVRLQSQQNVVLVSEYTAPEDFEVVWQQPITTGMKDKTGHGIKRVEKLFTLMR